MPANDVIEHFHQRVRDRAAEFEKARRLPADLAQEMKHAGMFRMLLPAAYGGEELPPQDAFRAIERIAQADASVAWCMMISSTSALALAYLPEAEARAIAQSPEIVLGGVFAPRGKAVIKDGDYRVSGRWQWASNSANCDWLLGGCVIIDNGEMRRLPNGAPDARMMLFPARDVTLIDSWNVTGLCGTGSGEMEVSDLVVPGACSVSLMTDPPVQPGPLYIFPVFGMLALGIGAVALGNARAAIDDLGVLSTEKTPQASARKLAGHAYTQAEVAKAHAALESARAYFYGCIEKTWGSVSQHGEMTLQDRAELRLAATHAVRTSADVATAMYELAGGNSVFLENSLQRRFRDAHVATQHMMTAPATYELAGRVLLGQDTDATFL